LAALCRSRGVPTHCDAVQAVGKIDVDFRALGADAMTVAAHKFGGPLGVGALVLRRGVELPPFLFGGFQQAGLRPGTESPALVAGFAAALEVWAREATARTARLAALRDELERLLLAEQPELVVHGRDVPRLPQTLNIALPGVDRQAMFLALDQAGVACSTGSACASGSSEPSPTLRAMGCSADELASSLRFSVGCSTTLAEVVAAAERILHVLRALRRGSASQIGVAKSGSSGRLSG
jgi:cysteine desulfurase